MDTTYPNQPPASDNDLCTLETCPLSRSPFNYRPRLDFTSVLLAIFTISLFCHLASGIFYKTWGFLVAMFCACGLEIIGYIGRAKAYNNPFALGNFLMQITTLTLAPVFYCAGIYLCLSRIVIIYSVPLSRIRPVNYTRIFISCDVVSLIFQGVGGAIASGADDPIVSDHGVKIMLAGLSFQVITLFLFSGLCLDFAVRVRRHYAMVDKETATWRQKKRFQGFLFTLALVVLFIIVRSIYRLAELNQGFHGSIPKLQVPFFLFEGMLIALASVSLNLFHPGFAFGPYWTRQAPQSVARDTVDIGSLESRGPGIRLSEPMK